MIVYHGFIVLARVFDDFLEPPAQATGTAAGKDSPWSMTDGGGRSRASTLPYEPGKNHAAPGEGRVARVVSTWVLDSAAMALLQG